MSSKQFTNSNCRYEDLESVQIAKLKEQLAEERHKKRLYWDMYEAAMATLLNKRK